MTTETWKWVRQAARWAMAGCFALGGAASAWAGDAPPVQIMLRYKPSQDGVVYTIPKPEEEAGLKVESVKGGNGGNGWMLKDAAGKPLRLFFNTNPTPTHNIPDVWAYYKDGVEVYRESESETKNYVSKPDQFRWLNGGGMKWGVDEAKEGHIKHWKMISPEEVSQEVLQALANKDFARLQALMITDAEMTQLGLPADEVAHVHQLEKAAPEKFQKTIADLPKLASGKPNWVHLETAAPECTPAEQTGGRADVIKYPHASVLFEVGGATDWVQTGELIQVGPAWRLIDAPTAGAAAVADAGSGDPRDVGVGGATDPKVMALVNELTELDKKAPEPGTAPNPALAKHHLARTDLLEKIATECKPEQREPWLRQMADSLSTAAQNSPAGDGAAMKRLVQLEESMVKAAPGSNLAAYVTYREMQADYAVRITKEEYAAAQKEWVDRLTKFVETYSKAEDAPDALLHAGHGQRVPQQGSGGEELVRRAGEELRRHAAGQEGGRLHRPAGAGRQGPQAGRPDADRLEHDLQYRTIGRQGGGRLLLGELDQPVGRRLRQAQGAGRRRGQGRRDRLRQPGRYAEGGARLFGDGPAGRRPPVPERRHGKQTGDRLRHHRAAEPDRGRQGRQGRQPQRPDQHLG